MGFWDFITGTTPAGVISETGQKVVTGIFSGVTEIVKQFHLSPEDELKFKMEMARLELESTKTTISDIQSARSMQMSKPSPWPGILSTIITMGFFGALLSIIKYGLPTLDQNGGQAILILLGTLTAGFSTVVAFWLGSSRSSQTKDDMIWHSTAPSEANTKKSEA